MLSDSHVPLSLTTPILLMQSASGLAFALALMAVAWMFRRRGVFALALAWSVWTLGVSWRLIAPATFLDANFHVFVMVGAVLATFPLMRTSASELAGIRSASTRPPLEAAARVVGAAIAIALLLALIAPHLGPSDVVVEIGLRLIVAACYLGGAVLAWRVRGVNESTRAVSTLLAISLGLFATRVTVIGLALAMRGLDAIATNESWFAMFISLQTVASGVLALLATLLGERRELLLRAERIRETDARMAQADRLESLGRLAGGVAHDFNNVLTAIVGGIGLARLVGNDVESLREELTEIEAAAGRGHELTRQLLAFSRRDTPSVCRFAPAQRIESLGRMLRRVVGSGVGVDTTLPTDGPEVELDPTQFDQLVMNLVLNARDAMPRGGRIAVRLDDQWLHTTRVLAHGEISAGRYARLTVEDDGVGIPPEVLPRIFEPFFTTKGVQGTGLGLATCYGVVSRAGGAISVHSEVGRGTCFEVLLPALGNLRLSRAV